MDIGSNTRSALLWEVGRILEECKEENCLPDVLLMENVPQVCGKKNIDNFNLWLSILKDLGYSSSYKILNAKDYGVPQNRKRCFCISTLGNYDYEFPEPVELKRRIKDILEDKVDDKYYINTERAEHLIGSLIDKGELPTISDETEREREREREGIDLTTNEPTIRTISNAIKAGQRGITNFRQDEIGVLEL